jgi:hypothetical protein
MTNIAGVFSEISVKKLTGKLTIVDTLDASIYWDVYFEDGVLFFAGSGVGKVDRLDYAMAHLQLEIDESFDRSPFFSDYDWLCELHRLKKLSFENLRRAIIFSIKDALINIMSINNAEMEFSLDLGLVTIDRFVLMRLSNLKVLIEQMNPFILRLAKTRHLIPSPLSRSRLLNSTYKYLYPTAKVNFPSTWGVFEFDTIYQITARLGLNYFDFISKFAPLVEADPSLLLDYGGTVIESIPLIVCIHPSESVQFSLLEHITPLGYKTKGFLSLESLELPDLLSVPVAILASSSFLKIRSFPSVVKQHFSTTKLILMMQQSQKVEDYPGFDVYLKKPYSLADLFKEI